MGLDGRRFFRPGAVALTAACLTLAGCSFPGFGSGPDEVVGDLARALGNGKLDDVSLAGPGADKAQGTYDEVVKRLRGIDPVVSAGPVFTDGDRATADLVWQWRVGERLWQYSTKATFVKADGSWAPVWSPKLIEPSLAEGDYLSSARVAAERGDIVGGKGGPLITERPVVRLGIDKVKVPVPDQADSARELAELVEIDADKYVAAVENAGPKAFVPAIVLRRPDFTVGIVDGMDDILGATSIEAELPLAPTKDFGTALLGTVGPATAELVKASNGRILAGDQVGLTGLERRYDEQLSGTPGLTISVIRANGDAKQVFETAPVDGKPVKVTIDRGMQQAAQDALAEIESASALVAIRPSTGEVLAAASGPGSEGQNTATAGQFPPGSTFKVVSALAYLRSGFMPDTEMRCDPQETVNGKRFENYDDYPLTRTGRIDLEVALANSCNTAFISQREKIEKGELLNSAAALGFGVDYNLGFPAYFGQAPEATEEAEKAADLIGQGKILASPLAMAVVAATVAQGAVVVPRLLPAFVPEPVVAASPLTADEANQLRQMMREVVEDGSADFLADLDGPPILAKTGTAEFGDTPPLKTHAWMIAAQGDLAIAVFVADGESGSSTAGPILEDFLEAVS